MTAHLIRGDARNLPLKDGSVQLVVCSPPYFGLRSYGNQISIWGGDPDCPHALEDDPAVKPMTGETGAASGKQLRNNGSQFGNAWVDAGKPKPAHRNGQGSHGLMRDGRPESARVTPQLDALHKTAPQGGATCTRCGGWRGELGSEKTPAEFVAHIVEVMRECWRVLRDDGVAFVNMGDSYGGSGKGPTGHNGIGDQGQRQGFTGGTPHHAPYAGRVPPVGARQKSLLLVPERLAIALSDDGWIVRQIIVWSKNNPMPESVRDRWTSAHEYILMLTKQGRYFFDQQAIAEPASENTHDRGSGIGVKNALIEYDGKTKHNEDYAHAINGAVSTRNGRSVWEISSDPYKGAHYAVFPRDLVARCVRSASSEYGACAACGAAWRRVVERVTTQSNQKVWNGAVHQISKGESRPGEFVGGSTTTTGWQPTCRCGPAAGVRPCVVLDPFSGSGTVAYQAARMGRIGVGVELSAEYIAQAQSGRLAQGFLPFAAPSPEAPRLPVDVEVTA